MRFVDLEGSRRVQDAALHLLDTCREVAKQSPSYTAGESNIDEVVSLAVQSLLMADHWSGREDRVAAIKPSEATLRIKGMAEALGLSIGSLPGLSSVLVLGIALKTVKSSTFERVSVQGRERDMMKKGGL
ncbi:MAG: hypothetical protein DI531_08020 [Brevundimonas sp.]|uniref:hypothetical protein n=1 Tax=Brevundimonas sp. TaxID=1871086 RepID=UPI000DB10F21|nr:hypothetical protein [Brevundimonas sp.]PZU74108.1 MAG: hypothetical protein DI531_08020 [Brevundimonas sp.]